MSKRVAYTTGAPSLGPDGKYQVALSKVAIDRPMTDDEVDLDDGFLMVPAAVPISPVSPPKTTVDTGTDTDGGAMTAGEGPATITPVVQPSTVRTTDGGGTKPNVRISIRIAFPASRDDVFKSFHAIANLADKSDGGKIRVVIDGQCAAGYDPNWLRNAVQEPLDEANIDGLQID